MTHRQAIGNKHYLKGHPMLCPLKHIQKKETDYRYVLIAAHAEEA